MKYPEFIKELQERIGWKGVDISNRKAGKLAQECLKFFLNNNDEEILFALLSNVEGRQI